MRRKKVTQLLGPSHTWQVLCRKASAATEAATAVPGFLMKPRDSKGPQVRNPKGPSTQIVGFQGPKTIQSMDFGT